MECEPAMLVDTRKYKKVIAWSGDFGIDQYVSCWLPPEELCLDVIWTKFEEFCKPQTNEVRAKFDLLTSFRQGDCSVDEWYNAVQAQINIEKYPPKTAKILHRDEFCFFLRDEELVSKTINDSNIDLNKFPADKVKHLAKKMESSNATPKYIKQVASKPQTTQVHLMWHQHTELPPNRFQRKQKKSFKSRQATNKHYQEDKWRERMPQAHIRNYNNHQVHTSQEKYSSEERCNKCGDSLHVEGYRCSASRWQCKNCHKFGHSSRLWYKKKEPEYKRESRKPRAHQLMAGRASAQGSLCHQSAAHLSSSNDSFCLQMQVKSTQAETKLPSPQHLITN